MERSTIFHGKTHYKWPFSIAFCMFTRPDNPVAQSQPSSAALMPWLHWRWQREWQLPPYPEGTGGTGGTTVGVRLTSKQKWVSHFLVGGWPTPLKNMLVTWDDDIPNWMGKKKCSKPPTSFCIPCLTLLCIKSGEKDVSLFYQHESTSQLVILVDFGRAAAAAVNPALHLDSLPRGSELPL